MRLSVSEAQPINGRPTIGLARCGEWPRSDAVCGLPRSGEYDRWQPTNSSGRAVAAAASAHASRAGSARGLGAEAHGDGAAQAQAEAEAPGGAGAHGVGVAVPGTTDGANAAWQRVSGPHVPGGFELVGRRAGGQARYHPFSERPVPGLGVFHPGGGCHARRRRHHRHLHGLAQGEGDAAFSVERSPFSRSWGRRQFGA